MGEGGNTGGGEGSGEEGRDDRELSDADDDPELDRSGVSISASSTSMSGPCGALPATERSLSRAVLDDGRDELFCRFDALWELSEWSCEDADDSSNVRFGDRYERASLASNGRVGAGDGTGDAREGNGETERDTGRGICDGVCGSDASAWASAATLPFALDSGFVLDSSFVFTFDTGFFTGTGEGGVDAAGAGVSMTLGRPECGPRRFRIDEKCSQSW